MRPQHITAETAGYAHGLAYRLIASMRPQHITAETSFQADSSFPEQVKLQ